MAERAMSILAYGPAKVGKTTFSSTAPTPMLFMDGENSSRFLMKADGTFFRKIYWEPMAEAIPEYDGTWDICVVKVTDWKIAMKTYEYLKTNNHPFRSLVLDSISEMQYKLKNQILGNGATQMKMQDWGNILSSMGKFLRDIRDLTADPKSPLEATVLLAMAKEVREQDGTTTMKPYLEGSIVQQVPYFYDMTGYLYQEQVTNPDTNEVVDQRSLLTVGIKGFEAGNRVHFKRENGRAVVPNPNVSTILDMVFGPSPLDN